jgi:NAD(P)H-nitrite reductase large subunit
MRYLIIGNSAAGNAAAKMIVASDPAGQVMIFSDEPHEAYYRPLIPNRIDGTIDDTLLFRDERTGVKGVEKRLGKRVETMDPQGKSVTLEGGDRIPYDRLLLATGSSAQRPALPGMEAKGVHTLRTLNDADEIKRSAGGMESAAVIGAGRVGMKAASALKHLGLEVTVVEKLDHVVPLQFDRVAGELVGAAVEAQGINLLTGRGAKRILQTNGRAGGVELEDGRQVKAQVVVVATGVVPNVELTRAAGVAVDQGVLVDPFMRTNIPDIYAAGDVAEVPDIVTSRPIVSGLWTNAVEMGRVAGKNMAGEHAEYAGAFSVLNALELAGVPTVSIGLTDPPPGEAYEIFAERRGDDYRKLVLKEGLLMGALLVGDIEGAGIYTGLIKKKAQVEPFVEELMAGRPGFARWFGRYLPAQ